MTLVDSHCHLEMIADTAGAVAEARAAGVGQIVTIGIDLSTSKQAIGLAAGTPGVYATVGLHPHEAHLLDDAYLAELEELAARPRVVAIGEAGLDFYRDLSPREDQRRAFSAQIELARRTGLPLVVHVREAGEEAMAQLSAEAEGLTVVMHCFSLPEYVDECNERGYYASFAGNVTYKNAAGLREAAARVRDDRLLVETDAPFLTPHPYRGAPNEPYCLPYTVRALAELTGRSAEDVASDATANAVRVYGLTLAD